MSKLCQKQWQKNKTIKNVKQIKFKKKHRRNNFERENLTIRKISGKKSQLFKKISRLSNLRLNSHCNSFNEKTQMFKQNFFFFACCFKRYKEFHICKIVNINKKHREKKFNKTIFKLKAHKAFKTN